MITKIPPQSIETEESVLASCLLGYTRKAVNLITGDDFYRSAHQKIFTAISELQAKKEPIDLNTVVNFLREKNQLEEIGGALYLTQLIDRVPLASNIEIYCKILREKSVLRKLINESYKIIQNCFDPQEDVGLVLEQSRRSISSIQYESKSNISSYHELSVLASERYEKLYQNKGQITGISSGFIDIDWYTCGFQPTDFIILAARPSMGKTALGLNIARNIANQGNAVLVFSLEMSDDQLYDRQISSESQVNLQKFRSGRFTEDDWDKLNNAQGKSFNWPVYIEDSAALHYSAIRSRAYSAIEKYDIKIIIIDYLQLIKGDKETSRDREVAGISAAMKAMAKEFEIPVIVLSQLNRSLENRSNDKRPRLSDLRDCVPGDTNVLLSDGSRTKISDLVGKKPEIVCINNTMKITTSKSEKIWMVGRRKIQEVILTSGKRFKCTNGHKFLTIDGFKKLSNLKIGDRIATVRKLLEPKNIKEEWPYLKIALLGQLIGDGSYLKGQSLRYTTESEANSRIVRKAAIKIFGCEVKKYRGRNNWHQLLISGNGDRWHHKGVNKWLRELGIFNQRSHQKRIPMVIYGMSDRAIKILVAHLWATDGSITIRKKSNQANIHYSTNSKLLAEDVAFLLLRIGIVSIIKMVTKKGYKNGYMVLVSGAGEQLKFLKTVRQFGLRAIQAKRVKSILKGLDQNTNIDTIPNEIFLSVKKIMKNKGITHRQMAKMRNTSFKGNAAWSFSPSRKIVKEYARLLDSKELEKFSESDLFWDQIKEINDKGYKDVYDITVPKYSNWISDGIISHNSGTLEQDSDLIMFLYRPAVYAQKEDYPGHTELNIAKHRNGPTGTINLIWQDRYTKFLSKTRD